MRDFINSKLVPMHKGTHDVVINDTIFNNYISYNESIEYHVVVQSDIPITSISMKVTKSNANTGEVRVVLKNSSGDTVIDDSIGYGAASKDITLSAEKFGLSDWQNGKIPITIQAISAGIIKVEVSYTARISIDHI